MKLRGHQSVGLSRTMESETISTNYAWLASMNINKISKRNISIKGLVVKLS